LSKEEYDRLAYRLANQKNGEVMVGILVPRGQAIAMSAEQFVELATRTFRTLAPLYKMAFSVEI
jgi:uncharacterized protein YktB (UPF0637 family)